MAIELFLDLISQPCRAVYIFAKANSIPIHVHSLQLLQGEHMSDEFGKVNSLKRLPALKDEDFTLAECVAILHYLSQKYSTPSHWDPLELQPRARMEEYLSWHADSVRGTFGAVLWIRVLGPLIDFHVPREKVSKNISAMTQALQHLEEKFLKEQPFLTGTEITLADLMSLEELIQAVYAGVNVFEGRPKLAAWRDRVETVLGKELCQEARKPLHKLCEDPKSYQDIPELMQKRMRLRLSKIP